jgi:heterodisulfide reductase subunit A-like polyferredoxin
MDENKDKKIGAVLVQGGGVAGIQASLDLANAGFKVYLIERSAAIGGMMSRLDKTFPTGDCATCIVSPKLVECARNINIKIYTLAELVDLKGDPGHFTATIKSQPRYVDEEKCTACAQCSEACPVNIPNEFDRNLGTRKAVDKPYAQATPNIYDIMKKGHAPCKVACPANINVQGYIQLIKKKEYIKAVNLIRERNPLSAICGRVCTHPCESECTRQSVDEAVAIRLLKKFASDKEMEAVASGELQLPEEKTPPADAKKVAIIGAGPAGLTAADDLAGRGFAVTVYEATSAAGGMLRWGIPEFRLPKNILDFEVDLVRRKGVTFNYNTRIGGSITLDKLRQENDAVFIAVGTHKARHLGIENDRAQGVINGTEFLYKVNSGEKVQAEDRVVIVGGGNVAIDCARTCIRLGFKDVNIVYRRSRDEMPAIAEEIHGAEQEGVRLTLLTGPNKVIVNNGKVTGLECLKMQLGEPDDSGRRRPEPVKGSEFIITSGLIIAAVGEEPDLTFMGRETAGAVAGGRVKTDPVTLATDIPGVFAGGDAVTGAATVIEAVAAGKRAAESITRYLENEDQHLPRFEDLVNPVPEDLLPPLQDQEKKQRMVPAELAVVKRMDNFDEVEGGLTEEDALRESERCLNCALCSECLECVKACEQNAIDHEMTEQTLSLEVGSVILAPGFEEFDATRKGEFGYKRYPNVLTSVQFERMLSASGPFEGRVIRRSDGREAKRIAWIQCVGSRDKRIGNEYCSSVCCMVSTKQALVAIDHMPDIRASIFYMDIRAHGKDFDRYYERAKNHENIQYVKSIPSRILQVPGSRDLRVRYTDGSGQYDEKDFDLVVLSVGMEPGAAARETARRLGIELNEYGFCATDRLAPLTTSRPGVFVAGAFQEPKDIPETVTQASAAASMSMELLAASRDTLTTKKTYPNEHDVTDEKPRIGVFVCHCGKNIASVVDVERVTKIALEQPDVVFATHTMYTCADNSLQSIQDMIHEHKLNRVVVASCTPRTHEPIFHDTLRDAGLNPYLFELANIRDQCSWVHSQLPEQATEKAIELMKMSVARARRLSPLKGSTFTIDQTGIVIGGGLGGMTAALALANQGFSVHLIERSGRLGGNLVELDYTLERDDITEFAAKVIQDVTNNPNIELHLDTEVTGLEGYVGSFQVAITKEGKKDKVAGGAIIVATGAGQMQTQEYLYGKSERVITQTELEKSLHENKFSAKGQNVVMIQCVGSRNEEHPYCSRLCCSMAVKNALRIKRNDPNSSVFVLYRDIRTYGFREKYYQQAREAGVLFIRYEPETPPEVKEENGLTITINSPDFPEPVEIEADTLVLSTGVAAAKDNHRLADILKVPLNSDGFFVEAHMKLRPVEFATEGIYLCGLAHSPKLMDENISQARAAAARAATILSKTQLEVGALVSKVDQDKCISCMTCIRACPYGAPTMNINHKAEIVAANCMGCGICAAECPAHAIQLNHFETIQFDSMIDELFKVSNQEKKTEIPVPE